MKATESPEQLRARLANEPFVFFHVRTTPTTAWEVLMRYAQIEGNPPAQEKIVFRGIDQGSAHAVAQGLAFYAHNERPPLPIQEEYAVRRGERAIEACRHTFERLAAIPEIEPEINPREDVPVSPRGDHVGRLVAACLKQVNDRGIDDDREILLAAALVELKNCDSLTVDVTRRGVEHVQQSIAYWEGTDLGREEPEFYELLGTLKAWLEANPEPSTDPWLMDERQLAASIRQRVSDYLEQVRHWGTPTTPEYAEQYHVLQELLSVIKHAPLSVDLAHRLHTAVRGEIMEDIESGVVDPGSLSLYGALSAYIGDDLKGVEWGGEQ